MKTVNLILLGILLSGCATSKTGKTYEAIGYSAGLCGLAGASGAPSGENKMAHGLLWAGICGTTAALLSNSLFDDKEEVAELREKNKELQTLITEIQSGENEIPENIISHGQNNFFERPPPEEFLKKIIPGKWYVYKEEIVRNEDGEKSVSIGKRFKIVPPRVKGEKK